MPLPLLIGGASIARDWLVETAGVTEMTEFIEPELASVGSKSGVIGASGRLPGATRKRGLTCVSTSSVSTSSDRVATSARSLQNSVTEAYRAATLSAVARHRTLSNAAAQGCEFNG